MITDSDLLDVVRKLRSYMSTMDSIHIALDKATQIEDITIIASIGELNPKVVSIAKSISDTLKLIEGSKHYKHMSKQYNLKEKKHE